jgi:hypothetical protein
MNVVERKLAPFVNPVQVQAAASSGMLLYSGNGMMLCLV